MNVENKTTLTLDDITYLMAILQCRINDAEESISFFTDCPLYPEATARTISRRTKSIEHDKSIIKKLESLGLEVLKK